MLAGAVPVLGMGEVTFGDGRRALAFGQQKINLHQAGAEFEPKARHPKPGSADLCFLMSVPLEEIIVHLGKHGVAILEGPDANVHALLELPGVGRYIYEAIANRDYPVVQGVTIVIAAIFVVVSMTVDILYAVLDPRLRTR